MSRWMGGWIDGQTDGGGKGRKEKGDRGREG